MQFFYIVRSGDTLSQIAGRWALPVDSLIAANNIGPPYTIYVGQQLSVPPGVDVYRVKAGDSIYKIAQLYSVPQSVIIEANRLQPPFTIQVGQLIKVPPGNPYYIVQPGDTLFQIALKFNVRTGGHSNPELIRQVNQLASYDIFPGMRLIIPYAPPGDLGLIAYTSILGATGYDIWVYQPRDGVNIQLTTGLGESYSIPYWSPDTRKIAFVGRNAILYIASLEGGHASIDQFAAGEGQLLSWSPDSNKLAYTNRNAIILYDVSTHQAERINQQDATDVQWFPSGTELLFQAPDTSGISQLFRINADGTRKQQITQNTGTRYNHVRLSPDGAYVLYTTPGASISIIYTLELSTVRVTEVKGGPLAKNYFPFWSPNSSSIAYSATAFDDKGYFSLIRTTGRQGENDRTRAISNCFAVPVTWSPDSRKIAYLSGCNNQGTASEIWYLDTLHPVPIRLVAGGAITALAWSPKPISGARRTYTNPNFKVQLQYPGHWRRVTEERYEGQDGFFQISAISSEEPIHTVCQNEAFHQLQPYGSQPRVISGQVQSQEACFIYPSDDQPAEMRGQSALIVRYPQPIQIEGTTYHYLILWADQNHINEIGSTLRFL
nr:LysM peptidoglycan-binding domain-containing protein [Neobacillus sp. Marseille-Q6967]